MFKMDESWSNDKTVCYYQGLRMKFVYPMIKAVILSVAATLLHGKIENW